MPKKITLSDFKKEKPNYKNTTLPKEKLVLSWLIEWVTSSLSEGTVEHGDILPLKSDIARLLDVSSGTVQNALRCAEDLGYFESKQRVGTMIRDRTKTLPLINKMFSKKDKVCIEIKKLLTQHKIGSPLPSVRKLCEAINASSNTTRLALDNLVSQGILEQKALRGNENRWYLKEKVELKPWEKQWKSPEIDNQTLSKKLEQEIKELIKDRYKIGDKIMPNEELAKHFQVSIRTINDATKTLQKSGLILSRRGQYGTIYIGEEQKTAATKERAEKSIFMSNPIAKQKTLPKNHYLYSWEVALGELKKYIVKNYEAGDKIPSMRELAQILKVSPNTVRTAVYTLCLQGILHTQRGKYGGTYVISLPEKDSEAFTWLALNPQFMQNLSQ